MASLDSPRVKDLVHKLRSEILHLWPASAMQVNLSPIIPVQQYLDYACVPPHIARQEQLQHFFDNGFVLRRQLADSLPEVLRSLAGQPLGERLLVCSGLAYQRGADEQLQTRHELALWRLVSGDISLRCIDQLIEILSRSLPLGLRLRTRRCEKPYLVYGRGIEVYCGGWQWIGHAGLLNPMMFIESGFDPVEDHGLALSVDLDRCLAVQNRWDAILLKTPVVQAPA